MKYISIALLSILLAACGGYQEKQVGLEEHAQLIIRAETLVGLQLSIEPGIEMVISKEDLTPYTMGVAGAADKEVEGLQTITLKVNPGNVRVTVRDSGRELMNREIYIATGQTRDLRVR